MKGSWRFARLVVVGACISLVVPALGASASSSAGGGHASAAGSARRHADPLPPAAAWTPSTRPGYRGSPKVNSSWQGLTRAFPGANGPAAMLQLTDGTVMVQEWSTGNWYRLTPDSSGSYVDGTWSQMPSMPGDYAPTYFASAVLADGRVIVMGGEYNGACDPACDGLNQGAIFDPTANGGAGAWQKVDSPMTSIGDAQSVVLADGRYMLANAYSFSPNAEAALLDPSTMTWTPTGAGKASSDGVPYDEQGWTLLPDGTVLTVDTWRTTPAKKTEVYTPATGAWTDAGNTPAVLGDTNGEMGPAALRPDGTVLALGASGANAIYDTATKSWAAGPAYPTGFDGYDVADGPTVTLPDGHVLVGASPGYGHAPEHFFDFDGSALTQVADPPSWATLSSYYTYFLLLPTGQVLSRQGAALQVYTDKGKPKAAWRPKITSVPTSLTAGSTYTISGKQLNGLTQGAVYGDDYQDATNYPLVRITNGATGDVVYARTAHMTSMSVTPNLASSAQFTLPATTEAGPSTLEVVANGIASRPKVVDVGSNPGLPAGYIVVRGTPVNAPTGKQTSASVACPAGTSAVGGGAASTDSNVHVNLNSSYPNGTGWTANLNNTSGFATPLTVFAVCVKTSAKITVNAETFVAPPKSQAFGQVACPTGVIVGGGIKSFSKRAAVDIASLIPGSTKLWDGWVNNASARGINFTVYAICRKGMPAGYSYQFGAETPNPAHSNTYTNVACPGNSVPLSGGAYSFGTGIHQNVNNDAPYQNTWYTYFNNGDKSANTVQAAVVCAGT